MKPVTMWALTRDGKMFSNILGSTRNSIIQDFFGGNRDWYKRAKKNGYGIVRVKISEIRRRS